MSPRQIKDLSQLDAALGADRYLLFKHSFRCSISTSAFKAYEAFVASGADVATGWIDVVEQRDWSQDVARRSGIEHASPQALWIVDGKVVWNASHFDITAAALTEATAR